MRNVKITVLETTFNKKLAEKYAKSVTSVVLDAYEKIVVDQVTKFDEAVKDKIR